MMNGKVFEVGTDVHEIAPKPDAEEVQGIVYAAFLEAQTLPSQQRVEVGQYVSKLANTLLEK